MNVWTGCSAPRKNLSVVVNRSLGSTVLAIGTALMRLCRWPSSTNQPITGSQSGAACRIARCGCDSAYGIASVGLGGAATLMIETPYRTPDCSRPDAHPASLAGTVAPSHDR